MPAGNNFCHLLITFSNSMDPIFFKFSKTYFRNTIRVSNNLDPDQDRGSVGPYLYLNHLQRLSADDKENFDLWHKQYFGRISTNWLGEPFDSHDCGFIVL